MANNNLNQIENQAFRREIKTMAEAADYLRITRQTLWKLDGQLPYFRLGRRCRRYLQSDLDEFINRNRVAA